MHELTALPWFYLACLRGDPLRLAGDEAHHVRTTRRLVPGDAVVLFDGVGHVARGTIRGAMPHEPVCTSTLFVSEYMYPVPTLSTVFADVCLLNDLNAYNHRPTRVSERPKTLA